MKPGSKLNALVATKVMGWTSFGDYWNNGPTHKDRVFKKWYWKPSEDIDCAWEVVKKLGGFYTAESSPVKHHWSFPITIYGCPGWVGAEGDSAPHAICLAALTSVGFKFDGAKE